MNRSIFAFGCLVLFACGSSSPAGSGGSGGTGGASGGFGGALGNGAGTSSTACIPGQQISCACANGSRGAQACNADGSGYLACTCATGNGGAGVGGDAATSTAGAAAGGGTGGARAEGGAAGSESVAGASGAEGIPAVCGDGIIEGGEECDDHNTTPADGCSAKCAVNPGWACSGTPSVCTNTCPSSGPDDTSDQDHDGFSVAEGDCDDCDPLVLPGQGCPLQ
ncbi:MAG TPA: DUF4215 domain-containing protein [Polyangiaceae bacterium]|nr:DUF4215 domain-containing protein [Polyangiaceae bacterium]